MNVGKDNTSSGGGHGGGSGLRGGRTKQVARKHIDCGIVIWEPNLSRGDSDAASRRQRSQKSYPKHPNGKAIVEKPTIWTRGPYLMVRPPNGPLISYRRGVGGSYSRMGEGDLMADLAGTLHSLSPDILDDRDGTTLQDLSRDILDDGDNNDDARDDGDYDDGETLVMMVTIVTIVMVETATMTTLRVVVTTSRVVVMGDNSYKETGKSMFLVLRIYSILFVDVIS
ncbi:hypothetical protein HanRHA438_Chr13g0594621 [Helianthus annuus]|uniref:Uncharacterized protein n=1 Tax=Helianthus annuus TaxID=4232 RepID=A0A9K3HC42_HELAN|nr:hypothetical protein HanXRQr2_Chr13g0583971 [Helianthus annuus]KAJ0497388.1 hypothetical protein HanHA89_Chr13g0510851 [Helianthus annuus]KAJ0670902.1 hypothetical protein HanOQP8_Chr13g0479781 [Helianthus annuus]KAJ0857835.1 hypothetical protein HanRHA438_Chr13g0594621 [Helianthus annuus]